MPKNLVFLISLIVILTAAYITLVINDGFLKAISKNEIETAINQASHIYKQETEENRDLSNGPCLSDALLPNWVVDIAHNPRLPIDDLPQNQCPAYVEGKAEHIVELDPKGNLIKAE